MTVCRPPVLCTELTPAEGRSLWWTGNSSDSSTLCFALKPSLVFWIYFSSYLDYFTFWTDFQTQECPLWMRLVICSLLDHYFSPWARISGSAIVLHHSYWQEFGSSGPVSFSPSALLLMSADHGKYPLKRRDKSLKHVNTALFALRDGIA